MNINYVRELKRNYLTVELEGQSGWEYEARMLAENEISGLLRMRIKYKDGYAVYCYDITSRQPLGRLLEARSVTEEELRRFLVQLHDMLNTMGGYLLEEKGILLNPEYIYIEPETFQAGFCFVPGYEEDFYEKLSQLFQHILRHVNHKDRESVVLAYGLYQESLKDNYGIDDLMGLLAGEEAEKKKEKADKKENEIRRTEIRREMEEPYELYDGETGSERKEKEKCEEWEQPGRGHSFGSLILKQLLVAVFLTVGVSAAVWLLYGMERLMELKLLLAVGAAGLVGICVVIDFLVGILRRRKSGETGEALSLETKGAEGEKEHMWRIIYDEEDSQEGDFYGRDSRGTASRSPVFSEMSFDAYSEPDARKAPALSAEPFQTVLLSDCQDKAAHCRLESMSPEQEDINIPYFPFVIGKHKGLADYAISRDTVSRFHIKCDKNGDQYTITDLNSTNGTRVRGRMLDANETVTVSPGDEVMIAELGYIWR